MSQWRIVPMKFVETAVFTRGLSDLLSDDEYRALQLALLYVRPLNAVFATAPLTAAELGACFALPLVIVGAVETEKLIRRRRATAMARA